MKKKNLLFTSAAFLLTLLFATGCTNAPEEKKTVRPDAMIKAISIAGVKVTPLPKPATDIAGAIAVPIVVNTERPPLETDDDKDRIYYRPAQPVTVTLANRNQLVFFQVSKPDEEPLDIDLPHNAKDGATVTRTIGITTLNDDNLPEGLAVWIRVVAADESKEYIYKINVINQTHDTAVNAVTVGGYAVLDPAQTEHIGPWLGGATWADAAEGLVNLKDTETSGVAIAVTPRNNKFPQSAATVTYAKIPAGTAATAEPAWIPSPPDSFANNDILAVKVTASNRKNKAYLKIKVSVGGSPFLSSLTVNSETIRLGGPSSDMATLGGAYRVEAGATLTATPVTWAVVPVPEDPNATVTWAIVGKGVIPQDAAFTNPTSFSTTSNYLYIKVVSANSSFTMYYQVVYDERPKDTEHVRTGSKMVPIYRFTIPDGRTWGELGTRPFVRIKLLQEEAEYNLAHGYQRNFVFGELTKLPMEFDLDTFSINPGSSTWNPFQPFRVDRQAKDFAIDTPAPGRWYTVEWPLNNLPAEWPAPYGGTPDTTVSWDDQYWPDDNTTGDVFFGIGITHDSNREYWIKELSLVSEDGTFKIFCDLLGDGRVDSDSRETGFVKIDNQDGIVYLREMVADPTLN